MTEERTIAIQQQIADLIGDSDEKAKEIFSLTPDALAAKLDGVSAAEVSELADSIREALKVAADNGELDADALDQAAGGARSFAYTAAVLGSLAFMGYAVATTPTVVVSAPRVTRPMISAPYVATVRRNVTLLTW